MAKCVDCGKSIGILSAICDECSERRGRKQREATEQKERDAKAFAERAAAVQLTTALAITGYRIVKSVDVIAAENAFGLSMFQGLATGLTEAFGGESGTTQGVLADAKRTVLTRLRREAASLDANAVIAVALDYSEFSGVGKPILFLVASGTAVVVEQESASDG